MNKNWVTVRDICPQINVQFKWHTFLKLELGVPRNTCVTCLSSFRKLTKGNNSTNIDARVMDLVHGS